MGHSVATFRRAAFSHKLLQALFMYALHLFRSRKVQQQNKQVYLHRRRFAVEDGDGEAAVCRTDLLIGQSHLQSGRL